MAPSAQVQRAQAAVRAMKLIGFDPGVAKTVLKKLLKVYENNWEYIESENYRLLADSILDDQESTNPEDKEKDAAFSDEPELSRKRLRLKQENPGPLPLAIESDVSGETLIKRPKLVASTEGPLTNLRGKSVIPVEAQCSGEGKSASLSPQPLLKSGAIGEIETHHSHHYEVPSSSSGYTVPWSTKSLSSEHGAYSEKGKSSLFSTHNRDKEKQGGKSRNAICYKKPKVEPDAEVLQETAVVDSSTIPDDPMDEVCSDISENYDLPLLPCHAIPYGISDSNMQVTPNNGGDAESLEVSAQKETISEFACGQEILPTNLDIAFSNMGKVCQCAVDLAAESGKDPQEDVVKVTPLMEPLKISYSPHRMTTRSFIGSLDLVALKIPRLCMKGLPSGQNIDGVNNEIQDNRVLDSSCQNASHSLAVIPQQQHPISAPRPLHDESDIAKGEERVRISLINEYTGEKFPPFFHYIPQNVAYQKAHVNISLTRIGDEDCCLNCFGDCLSASIPCACTRETGGKFVYTPDGLLKKEFLNDCISVNCYPDKHHHVYCKDCPIEKSKNEHVPDVCKGHLVRKFIKECWSKCGCNKQCGNRVVQRGITRNLQVFYTADGKGWGLRPLEELPRGAFVCEYVGEILTNIELYNRTMEKTGSAKHMYPVLLDVDCGSKDGLRDEETLCLDATFFGNVGRFVNHRCLDANLVEVPVEWETPDHHYYHLAFFTTRKVEALEELTWDYGIDFADCKHPIKAFKCLCGSRFCRDRSKARGRSSGPK